MPDEAPVIPPATYAARLERLRAAAAERGLRPAGRLRRSRAQRQPRLPERVRSAVRGGDPRRWTHRRSGHPGRQRVLRHGRCGAAPHATASAPGPEPAVPAARPVASPARRPGRGRHHRPAAGWRSWAGRRTPIPPRATPRRTWSTTLRALTGGSGAVENATDLLIDRETGLRVINEVEQLAAFEYAACHTSNGDPAAAVRSAARPDRAGGGPAAGMERHAALVPPDADRRPARNPRPAEPRHARHRAR